VLGLHLIVLIGGCHPECILTAIPTSRDVSPGIGVSLGDESLSVTLSLVAERTDRGKANPRGLVSQYPIGCAGGKNTSSWKLRMREL
jgi:hypothetical protein